MANSVDPDGMPHSAVPHLGLHRLLRSVGPNTLVLCRIIVIIQTNTAY